ncbi:MAG: FGGY-family carbohydrate kinase [Acidimicrobiia bacterium]
MTELTVGIDIGTSSVKAVAVDGDGDVVGSTRIPHEYRVPAPERLEHDAAVAWRDGPLAALAALDADGVRGVCVSAMVPSLTAVDASGTPLLPGVLYGDERGRAGADPGAPATGMEFGGFVRWATDAAPDAYGLWPAQAVANHALSGVAAVDTTTASTAYPVYNFTDWDAGLAAELGARVEQFPRVLPTGAGVGTLPGDGAVLASGCIDAFAEQMVAGADDPGDVLVLLGTTLIVWVITGGEGEVPGYVVVPNRAAGNTMVGGPSNAGGMFCDWVGRMVGAVPGGATAQPNRVPVWAPYARGERSPLNDPDRRATLDRLDLTHDAAAVRRAAYEASGFVVRRAIDATREGIGAQPARIVASGGGIRVDEWVQALADATGLPVDCAAVPDGAALGSAWLARMAAGLEEPTAMQDARRWARVGRTVEPRAEWLEPVAERYERFRWLSDTVT